MSENKTKIESYIKLACHCLVWVTSSGVINRNSDLPFEVVLRFSVGTAGASARELSCSVLKSCKCPSPSSLCHGVHRVGTAMANTG